MNILAAIQVRYCLMCLQLTSDISQSGYLPMDAGGNLPSSCILDPDVQVQILQVQDSWTEALFFCICSRQK